MSEATLSKDANANAVDITAAAAIAAGEVLQLPSGRAAVKAGLAAAAVGDPAALQTAGQFTFAKTASVVILKGGRVYWDRSANTATPLRALAGADFFLGVALEDAASTATTVLVDLNADPPATIDLLRDPADTVLVLTSGTPSLSMGPGYAKMAFSATAEAQKVDMLSKHSIPVTIPFIVEMEINIVTLADATAAAVDLNVGIANATHASDGDAITESMFVHADGIDTDAAVNILLESDDGTTEVAATDTTVDFTNGTPFTVWFDCRDLTDIQAYVDGVNVLPASVFKLNAATGPMHLLAHVEKGANDTLTDVRINRMVIRAMDVE